MKTFLITIITLLALNLSAAAHPQAKENTEYNGSRVILKQDPVLEGAAIYGLKRLADVLNAHGLSVDQPDRATMETADFFIFAGLSGSGGPADMNLKVLNIQVAEGPEALVIRRSEYLGKPALILCGSDEVGLMYACLDVSQRISWAKPGEDPFRYVADVKEEPCLMERAVSMYTMQRAHFERFLYDENHMEGYFDMLASSRINSFVLIFGYENGGFMAPAYPYFFDVEGFPEVELVGTTKEQQAKNTAAFTRLIEIAHERGIRVSPGFWDYIYRGEVQGGGIPGASEKAGTQTPHLVWGVSSENLVSYNKAAITKFLQVFPMIDAIQFRIHWESGLTREETPAFWHDMLSIIKETRPDLTLDLRAKGLPDVVIDDAIQMGMNFRIATKYWMEQMGLPFHPTHINRQNQTDRRHGYADLLKYPQQYQMHWRLWNGGTSRLLLWSDPEYVRRFAETATVYGGNSFEVNEMLATKMLSADHSAEPFDILNPGYRYYDYEFERYWSFYLAWGRVAYNPDTPSDIWEQEYYKRFGRAAGAALMEGLHLASQVLPRIVAASYPYSHFPTTRGWAEMQRQLDLPEYSKAEGSDIQQFMNMAEYADLLLENSSTPKRTPLQTSQWFSSLSTQILKKVREAEVAADAIKGNEFVSTATDLRILAQLAAYHSHRLIAGVYFNLYEKSGDPFALDDAIKQEELAREAWSGMVQAAGDVYSEQLIFGVEEKGFPRHWKDQLDELDRGLKVLREMKAGESLTPRKEKREYMSDQGIHEKFPPQVSLEKIPYAEPGKSLTIHAMVSDPSGVNWVRLRFRHLTQFEDYRSVNMKLDPETGLYKADIPGEFILPEWDLIYFIEAMDELGNGCMIPDLEVEMPYIIVHTSQ